MAFGDPILGGPSQEDLLAGLSPVQDPFGEIPLDEDLLRAPDPGFDAPVPEFIGGVPTGVPLIGQDEVLPEPVAEEDIAAIDESLIEFDEPESIEPIASLAPAPALIQQAIPETSRTLSAGVQFNAGRVDDISGQIDRFDSRGRELIQQINASKDPVEKAALAERYRTVAEKSEDLISERDGLRESVRRGSDDLVMEAERQTAALTSAAANEKLEAAQELRAKAEASSLERAEKMETARAALDEDRAAYRAILKAGPKGSYLSVVESMGEILRAQIAGEVPNFGKINERAARRSQAEFAARAKNALALAQISTDTIDGQLALDREVQAQEAAAKVASFTEIEERLSIQLRDAATPLEEARASQALETARQERTSAEAVAAQKRIDANQKRRDVEAKIQLTQAKTGTELGKQAKTAAETAKLLRRGTGGTKVVAGLIAPNVVTLPGQDVPLVEFPDNAQGRKEAAVTRDIVGEQQSFLETMNEMEAFYEDAEANGLVKSIANAGTTANLRLQTLRGVAAAKLAQIKAGPGKATTEGDEKWATQFLPDDPKAWSNLKRGLEKLRTATSVFENESRSVLGRTTRLNTATRERIVREARKKSVSKAQRSRTLASKASQTARDKSKPIAERVKSVELIEENAKSEADEAGSDWLDRAVTETSNVISDIDDVDVEDALFEQLDKYDRFVTDRLSGHAAVQNITGWEIPDADRDRVISKKIRSAKQNLAKKKFAELKGSTRSLVDFLQFDTDEEE